MTRFLPRFFPQCVLLLALAPGAATADTLPATTCTPTGATSRTCALFAKPSTVTLPGAGPVTIWGYSDSAAGAATSPGPVLVVNQGDSVTVNLTNGLATATALRVTGQVMPADVAGVAPGATSTRTFVAGAPGTYLYEAGVLPGTQYQTAMGLYGVLVVRPTPAPATPQAYADPASAYDDEALVVLGEIDPDLNGSADPAAFDMRGFAPRYRLINGHPYPDTPAIPTGAGRRVLLRYANAGVEAHAMGLLGLSQLTLAVDGGPAPRPFRVVSQSLAAGQTADAVTTVPAGTALGSRFALYEGALSLHNASEPGMGGMLTFLLSGAGTPPGGAGPVTTLVAVSPSPTTGTSGATVTAHVASTGSTVTAAEYFIDTAGASGTGIAMAGTFGGASADVGAIVSAGTLAALPTGAHSIYVHGLDATSTWGPVSSAVLLLDHTGPAISSATAAPSPTNNTPALLSATGDDRASGGTNVDQAEYFVDPAGTPSTGTRGTAMAPVGGAADVRGFTATVPTAGLSPGTHTLAVRARDTFASWGAFTNVSLVVDRAGPAATAVAVTPAATNGTQGVSSGNASLRVTATITDAASRIAGAEAFIDAAGANGAGFPLIAADGSLDSQGENVFADVPLVTIVQLAQGTHTFLVHGRDAAGNWGATTSVSFIYETGTPAVIGVAATPNPTGGAALVTLTATAGDPAPFSGIAAAEWFEGADPGAGAGNPMSASDGAFGGQVEGITAAINPIARAWLPGNHTLSVRARDRAGTWSAVSTTVLVVQLPNAIFADGFESGGFSAWNGGVTGVGLSVTAAAQLGLTGTLGMQVLVGAGARYVTDNTPLVDPTYHARFYFDPNGTGTGGNTWSLFTGHTGDGGTGTQAFAVQFRRVGATTYQVRAVTNTVTNPAWVTIADSPHAIEIAWAATNTAGAPHLQLYVDGVSVATITTGNTSALRLESVRLGRPAGVGGAGTMYLDQFVSTRTTVIGP